MEFDWKIESVEEWRQKLTEVPLGNYLQSWTYAKAVRTLNFRPTRPALIRRSGQVIGMMAVQEAKLGPLSVVNLYRGPIWFTENPPQDWLGEFARAFDQEFPKRLFRRRRWMPEWAESESARKILHEAGFQKKDEKGYKTIVLDLSQPIPSLRSNLKQKWRNALNKGEKAGLSLREDWRGPTLELFIYHYLQHKGDKGYRGPSAKLLREEYRAASPFEDAVILWASKNKKPVAAMFVLLHGSGATYHAGWTSEEGRTANAHNVLMWRAILTLKDKGIRNFDLGWIDHEVGEGFTKFKYGLGGKQLDLIGVWG